jgi:hypothetical protein
LGDDGVFHGCIVVRTHYALNPLSAAGCPAVNRPNSAGLVSRREP